MCGLTGFITAYGNGFTNDEANVAQGLLWLTQLRGRDSTGVVGIDKDKKDYWYKHVGGPEVLFAHNDWTEYKSALVRAGKIMFGHCRFGTRGDVNVNNAHPFSYYKGSSKKHKIIGVHNGTLDARQSLDNSITSYEVDSQWLIAMLATHPPTKVLSEMEGAAALIWYDTELHTLNFYRNYQRPLYYLKTRCGKWLFNSTLENIVWAALNGKYQFDLTDIKEFDSYKIYTLSDKNQFEAFEITDCPKKNHGYYGTGIKGPNHWEGWDSYEANAPVDPKPSLNSSDIMEVWKMPRGFEEDVALLFAGKIDRVEFNSQNKSRKTEIKGNTYVTPFTEPYRPFLHRMFLPGTHSKTVRCIFTDEGKSTWFSEVKRPETDVLVVPAEVKPPALLAPPPPPDTVRADDRFNFCVGGLKFKNGKTLHFHTKAPSGKSIMHKAVCAHTNKYIFDQYANDIDGEVTTGEIVQIEVAEITRDKDNVYVCRGYRLREKQDACIEYLFRTKAYTEEQLKAFPYFQGRVSHIKLTDKQHYNEYGSVVEIVVIEAKPAELVNAV